MADNAAVYAAVGAAAADGMAATVAGLAAS
jgi:hypothetical protein